LITGKQRQQKSWIKFGLHVGVSELYSLWRCHAVAAANVSSVKPPSNPCIQQNVVSRYGFTVVVRSVYTYKNNERVNSVCGQYAAILMVKTGGTTLFIVAVLVVISHGGNFRRKWRC